MTNKDIMTYARSKLSGNWGSIIFIFFIYMLISCSISALPSIGSLIINLVITGPLLMGLSLVFLSLIRDESYEIKQLFKGFSFFVNMFVTYLIFMILIVLWTLLLIIPGIIASLSYSMTFFIVADNSHIRGMEALRQSKEMMEGHKGQLFYLVCRFIGWFLLGILTLGVGFLWIGPYLMTSMAKFYETIRNQDNQQKNPSE